VTGRIAEVRLHVVRAALHRPFVTALRRSTHLESLLVELVDDDGRSGWGESPQVWQVTGESVPSARAAVEGPLGDVVRGADPDDLAGLGTVVAHAIAANSSAKAAVDVALHDLAARRREVTLVQMLGGGRRRRIPTDVTLAAGPAEQLATDAVDRVGNGFGVLKAKVGTDAAGDVARVRAIRDAVGPDVRLRLDANQGWTPRQAVATMTAIENAGLDVELVEQPVPAHDLAGMAFVRARIGTPVLADESVHDVRDLVRVLDAGAADMVNVKLAKCGGLAAARTLVETAHAHAMPTLVGSMMETAVGVGAAAALVAALWSPATERWWLDPDLDAAWWLARSPLRGGAIYERAEVVLPEAPGSGIDGLA